jgi:hypothetical protein
MDAFYDTIGRYLEAGMKDFCFIYALGIDSWKAETLTTYDMLQKIALEAIPVLRNKV